MSTSFAVIVTSYNYRDFVVEAIDSALAQTRAPKQILVVDDGSTDGSQDLLRARYGDDARVTLLCGENGGQLAAFQRGVAASDADVLCFLDADDRWAPDYLAKIGEIYDSRKDVGFVFSDIVLFGGESRTKGEGDKAIDYGYTALATYALAHWYGSPTSALSMRKTDAERSLDLPAAAAVRWRLCADAALVYGASVLGARKYYLPTGAVFYRIHGANGWWSNRSEVAQYRNKIRARDLIQHYASSAGISDWSLESAKLEFRTKPAPSRAERMRYVDIAMMSPGPVWKRVERAASIFFERKKKLRNK
jgi:glycosyltransferase involved in cell wall biosynthesis